MFDSVLNTSVSVTAQWILWPYAINCIRHIQNNSGIFSTLLFQLYVGIFNHIQRCLGISTHIETLLRHIQAIIQAYSAPFVTLAYSQPYHILSHGIFRTGGLFKALWNAGQTYSEPCHRASFSHIQVYSEPCATLAYAETWHTRNLGICRTLP